MTRPRAYYNMDDLFKEGDVIYDKSTNLVFTYVKSKHYDKIKNSPNNYRVAHKGDYDITKFKKK